MTKPESQPGYEVGYGKPPKETRFKPGSSGNPKGRPKETRNAITILHKAMEEKVLVSEKGSRRKRSKMEVMCTQLANKAASGDLKAANLVFGLAGQFDPSAEMVNPDKLADQEMVRQLLARMNKNSK